MDQPERSELRVGACMTRSPHTIDFTATLAAATGLMNRHDIRHLPVVRDGRIVGVLSDRDIAIVGALAPHAPGDVGVAEAMTPVPYCVPEQMSLLRVVQRMIREKYGCAIITDDATDRVLGVFTVTDALITLERFLGAP